MTTPCRSLVGSHWSRNPIPLPPLSLAARSAAGASLGRRASGVALNIDDATGRGSPPPPATGADTLNQRRGRSSSLVAPGDIGSARHRNQPATATRRHRPVAKRTPRHTAGADAIRSGRQCGGAVVVDAPIDAGSGDAGLLDIARPHHPRERTPLFQSLFLGHRVPLLLDGRRPAGLGVPDSIRPSVPVQNRVQLPLKGCDSLRRNTPYNDRNT